MNGKIEGLEVELEALRKELESEINGHLKTKASLNEALLKSADSALELQKMQDKGNWNRIHEYMTHETSLLALHPKLIVAVKD